MDMLNAIVVFAPVVVAGYAYGIKPWLKRRRSFQEPQTETASFFTEAPQIEVQTDDKTPPVILQAPGKWLATVNDAANELPHLMVLGKTGSGKTTLARAILLLRHAKRGHFIVLSPKVEDDLLFGAAFVTLDDDLSYAAIDSTAGELLLELKRRMRAQKKHRFVSDQLTIVLDDFSILRKKAPNVNELFEEITTTGRSSLMRIMLLANSGLVAALGIEGNGELRESLAVIRLTKRGVATLEESYGEASVPIHIGGADDSRHWPMPAARAWYPPQSPDTELAGLLGLDNRGRTGMGGAFGAVHTGMAGGMASGMGDMDAPNAGMGGTNGNHTGMASGMNGVLGDMDAVSIDRENKIKQLVTHGVSANAIADTVKGDRNTVLARVRELKGANQ